jgi:hypothetical protein
VSDVSEMPSPADLAPAETELHGSLSNGITGIPDAVETRIQWLATQRLEPLARSDDGWDWLFRDPQDGRLWEQTYPLGSLHASGPRRLARIADADAQAKYPHD